MLFDEIYIYYLLNDKKALKNFGPRTRKNLSVITRGLKSETKQKQSNS